MSFVKRDVKDRVVQYPHRYQLVEVSTGTFDLVPVTGTITQEGTAINKAYLQPIEDALAGGIYNSSYIAFCSNVNSDSLDSAFGKNNEDSITGIGRQLAMYAWFKGDSRITYPFSLLLQCDTLDECLTTGMSEVANNSNVLSIILASDYGLSKLLNKIPTSDVLLKTICSSQTMAERIKDEVQLSRGNIITTLNASSLFAKTTETFSITASTTLTSEMLDTNTIIIPTSSPGVSSSNSNRAVRVGQYGADKNKRIFETASIRLDETVSITEGVSMRGLYAGTATGTYVVKFGVICDVYTVI